jgi:hypothetical protein
VNVERDVRRLYIIGRREIGKRNVDQGEDGMALTRKPAFPNSMESTKPEAA